MKTLILSALIALPIGLVANEQNEQEQTQEEKVNTGEIILAGFAKVINNFFCLVKNPNDAANVGCNVASIVHTVVDTAFQAMRSGKLPLDATEEEIEAFAQEVAQETQEEVRRMVIRRSREFHFD